MTAVYRLLLRTQVTKGRVAAVSAVALMILLLGFASGARQALAHNRVAFQIVDALGMTLLVPVTALVFASAALGEPSEDATLVYLWAKPVARSKLALAALGSTLTITVPAAVAPVVLTAVFARASPGVVVAALVASAVAVVAYSSLFVGLGLVLKRALTWGLAYVLIWEGAVARIGTGPARLSISHYARSVFRDLANRPPAAHDVSSVVGIVVPLTLAVLAVVLTTWRLARQDVR